jgi:hypothetical protein
MKPRNNRFGHREVLYELPKRRGRLPRANTWYPHPCIFFY